MTLLASEMQWPLLASGAGSPHSFHQDPWSAQLTPHTSLRHPSRGRGDPLLTPAASCCLPTSCCPFYSAAAASQTPTAIPHSSLLPGLPPGSTAQAPRSPAFLSTYPPAEDSRLEPHHQVWPWAPPPSVPPLSPTASPNLKLFFSFPPVRQGLPSTAFLLFHLLPTSSPGP